MEWIRSWAHLLDLTGQLLFACSKDLTRLDEVVAAQRRTGG